MTEEKLKEANQMRAQISTLQNFIDSRAAYIEVVVYDDGVGLDNGSRCNKKTLNEKRTSYLGSMIFSALQKQLDQLKIDFQKL